MTVDYTKPFEERDFDIEFADGKPTGKSVARAWAQWFLGDRGWASQIIDAYENPETYIALLKAQVEK